MQKGFFQCNQCTSKILALAIECRPTLLRMKRKIGFPAVTNNRFLKAPFVFRILVIKQQMLRAVRCIRAEHRIDHAIRTSHLLTPRCLTQYGHRRSKLSLGLANLPIVGAHDQIRRCHTRDYYNAMVSLGRISIKAEATWNRTAVRVQKESGE